MVDMQDFDLPCVYVAKNGNDGKDNVSLDVSNLHHQNRILTRLRAHPFHHNMVPQKEPRHPCNRRRGSAIHGRSLPILAQSWQAALAMWIDGFDRLCEGLDGAVKSHREARF